MEPGSGGSCPAINVGQEWGGEEEVPPAYDWGPRHAIGEYDDGSPMPLIFDAWTVPGMEGVQNVGLLLHAYNFQPQNLEYWIEDVSAELDVDYTDEVTIYPVEFLINGSGLMVYFPVIDDSDDEYVESFKIHVQYVGHPETEIVVEADILDQDAEYEHQDPPPAGSGAISGCTGIGGSGAATGAWVFTYDKIGNVCSTTDPVGNMTAYAYDFRDRLVRMVEPDPDGNNGPLPAPVTTYRYDVAGRLLSTLESPYTAATTYEYDDLDRVIAVHEPTLGGGGRVTHYAYSSWGNLTQVTDDEGRITSYAYTPLGQLASVQRGNTQTSYGYDDVGNLTSVSDALYHGAGYEYDNLNRRTKITDSEEGQTTFTYDAAGNLLSLTDSENNTTSWLYDHLGRTTTETNQLGKSRHFEYDPAGNLTRKIDRLGRATHYEYDPLGRLLTEIWEGDGRVISYDYDAFGHLTEASDVSATYGYTYDALGRLLSESQSFGDLSPLITYDRAYDAAGNRSSVSATIAGTADFKNSYSYDLAHRVLSVGQQGQEGGNAVAVKGVAFGYDLSGLLTGIYRYAGVNDEFVAATLYVRDGLGRVSKLVHTRSGEDPVPIGEGWNEDDLAGYEFTYDAANRITSINSLIDGLAQFTYDDTNQLTAATGGGHPNEGYTYDANGNRTDITSGVTTSSYTTGANNRLLSDGTFDYEYDDEGNRTAKVNIETGHRTEYLWDYRNRLIGVRELEPYDPPAEDGQGTAWDWGQTSGGFTYTGPTGAIGWGTDSGSGINYDPNAGGGSGVAWGWGNASDSGSAVMPFDPGSDLGEATTSGTVEWDSDDWDEELQDYVSHHHSGQFDVKAVHAAEGSSVQLYARFRWEGWSDFSYWTEDGTAGSSDYTSASGTFTLGDSDGEWVYVTAISLTNDSDLEGNETFTIYVQPDNQSSVSLTATIFDTEQLVEFVASAAAAAEGDDVVLTVSSAVPLEFEYWVEDKSAAAGTDYTAGSGTVWADLNDDGEVSFATADNDDPNATKSFVIHVRLAGHPDTEMILEADITDNDQASSFTATVESASEGNDVLLVLEADALVHIEYWTADASAADGTDYTGISSSVWVSPSSSQTIHIHTTENAAPNYGRSFEVHVRIVGAEEVTLEADINDDDGGIDPIDIDFAAQSATEGDDVIFTVAAVETALDFQYWIEDVSATAGVDFSGDVGGSNNWLTFAYDGTSPAKIRISTLPDNDHETQESFKIHLRVAGDPGPGIEIEADILDRGFENVQVITYSYDPFDRLIRRSLDADGLDEDEATDTFFSWLDNQITLQFAGADADDLSHRYFWNPAAIDQILADETVEDVSEPGSILWPLTDHLGTPRDLLSYNAATDEAAIVNHRTYDTFGNLTDQTDGSFTTLIGFTGVHFDTDTGLNYHRARWYDMAIGTWISEDPIQFRGDPTNLYRNVQNRPGELTDPSGLEPACDPSTTDDPLDHYQAQKSPLPPRMVPFFPIPRRGLGPPVKVIVWDGEDEKVGNLFDQIALYQLQSGEYNIGVRINNDLTKKDVFDLIKYKVGHRRISTLRFLDHGSVAYGLGQQLGNGSNPNNWLRAEDLLSIKHLFAPNPAILLDGCKAGDPKYDNYRKRIAHITGGFVRGTNQYQVPNEDKTDLVPQLTRYDTPLDRYYTWIVDDGIWHANTNKPIELPVHGTMTPGFIPQD